jgi:hypothetical protein
MENLINNVPPVIEQQVEMSVEQYTAAVQAAATQLQAGTNAVWQLGIRAVKMAYGGSQYAHDFVLALLNNLPQDAARQTHDWLKKAGITVNRPMSGSKLYWLSSVDRDMDGLTIKFITAKKPGEDGYGLTMEKAVHYVKTTPPMALERKEGKPKAVKVLVGAAKNRAREAVVSTMKRLQKTDLDAARELNEFVTTMDNTVSAFYNANGLRQALDVKETLLVERLLSTLAKGDYDAILAGEAEITLSLKS